LAFAGCVAQEGDEVASDEVASDEVASDEVTSEANAALTAIEIKNVTCNSGWPGTRGCHWVFFSLTDIVPGSIIVQINGHNGELVHTVSQTGLRQIDLTAIVREGDAFNPGVNTTAYTVVWFRI
jgi:hypothetical protein